MPTTPQYSWTQTDHEVVVTVSLKGHPRERVDVFVSDVVLKVNFQPFLLLLDLYGAVDDENAAAVFEGGQVQIRLTKVAAGLWETIEATGTKQALKQRREASIAAKEESERVKVERKREKRIEDGREALRKQMDLEESERSRLDGMKADEKAAAEREVFAALSRFQPPLPSAKVSAPRVASAPLSSTPRVQAVADDGTDSDEEVEADVKAAAAHAVPTTAPPAARRGDIWAAPSRSSASVDEEEVYVPPPRAARKALIGFTPRAFPTPMRESTGREEDDWLAKNRFKMKATPTGTPADSSSVEERDPVWLKGKGDDFYRAGDFASAISAYSAALELDTSNSACLSNRSACFLHVRRLEECVADCIRALALIPVEPQTGPTPPRSVAQRIKLFARQGTALCQLGRYSDALTAFQSAGALEKLDSTFAITAGQVSKLADLQQLKARGDTAFKSGEFVPAVEIFSSVLDKEPRFVAALSNRAAALLAHDQPARCIEDCNAVLSLLGYELTGAQPVEADIDCVPPRGSQRHKSFVATTLIRRGTAACRLGQYAEAVEDYTAALKLEPDNAQLVEDLKRVRARTAVSPSDLCK